MFTVNIVIEINIRWTVTGMMKSTIGFVSVPHKFAPHKTISARAILIRTALCVVCAFITVLNAQCTHITNHSVTYSRGVYVIFYRERVCFDVWYICISGCFTMCAKKRKLTQCIRMHGFGIVWYRWVNYTAGMIISFLPLCGTPKEICTYAAYKHYIHHKGTAVAISSRYGDMRISIMLTLVVLCAQRSQIGGWISSSVQSRTCANRSVQMQLNTSARWEWLHEICAVWK